MDPELPLPEMSSQAPEQIPMPAPAAPDERGEPPTSFTRELSPAEKSNALIQFMGAQYGALNQLDGQIEGHGALGKGSSEKVKHQVAQVLEQTKVPAPPAQAQTPVVPQQVPTEAQQDISRALVPNADKTGLKEVCIQARVVDPDQLEFNFNVDEKQELLSMVRTLIENSRSQQKKIDILTDKVNDLIKSSKKKSTKSARKTVAKSSKV